MKHGLIMEGGAMRGLFTAGVIDVMMQNGIEFDGAIGVSAGAAFGCNYKSKQIGRVLRYNKKFCNDKRYCGLRSLITTGDLYSTEFCYGTVPREYDIFDHETYNQNPIEFYVVCTDVVSGNPVYHNLDRIDDFSFEWIRASASMPLVSNIVEINGQKLLDGGMSDSIPLKFFESIGYNKNIVILTQPDSYVKKKNTLLPLIRKVYKKYPGIVNAMTNRHNMYNETIEYIRKREKSGEILVIRPEYNLPVGRIEKNPDNLQKAYDIGVKLCSERIDEIKDFLK